MDIDRDFQLRSSVEADSAFGGHLKGLLGIGITMTCKDCHVGLEMQSQSRRCYCLLIVDCEHDIPQ